MFGGSGTSKGFGEQKTGSIFGDCAGGGGNQGMQFGESPVFGTRGFSASASKFSFVDATRHQAFTSSPSPLFEGFSALKSDGAGFPSVFGRASNTSGSDLLVPERNSSFPSEPAAASGFTGGGGAFNFGSKLTPLGSTNTSNVPAFGNTDIAVATSPAFGFTGDTFAFGTKLTPLGSTNISNVRAFGNSGKAVAPAVTSGFTGGTFTFGSKLTPLGNTNASNVPVFGNTAKAVAPAVTSGFTRCGFAFGSKLTPIGVPGFGNTTKEVAPAAGSGFTGSTFTFGSKLMQHGSTNTSNVPTFGNTTKAVAPAATSGFTGGAFTFSSKLTPLDNINTSNVPAFGNKAKLGGENNTEAYRPTPSVDNAGKKTAQYLQSKSAMQNYQSKSHEELRWEDYQSSRASSLTDSAVQLNKKISSNTFLPSLTGSNITHTMQHLSPVSVENPAFTASNVSKQKEFGTSTALWPEFGQQLPAVTLEKAWWAVPQPAIVSIPTTPVPVAPSSNGQSLPSSPWFLEHTKPIQEPKHSLIKDPLQTSQGITFPTTLQEDASTPPKPVSNQIYNVGDVQPAVITNPFEGETRSLLSLSKSSTLVQQGISGIPMVSKPVAPVRISSILTCRKLSRSRIKIPTKKPTQIGYDPKVPFFYSGDEFPHAAKGHSWLMPRESPKAWVSNPTLASSTAYNLDITSSVKSVNASEISPGNLYDVKPKVANGEEHVQNNSSIISKISDELEPLELPKLSLSDYYTEPSIEQLTAKEKTEPGFLTHVKDFIVGRHGYGHIKFKGETDVRRLDITSILQFSHREILVYPDDSTKPLIGQGLNKAAEITLLNIKPVNRSSAGRHTDEKVTDKFKTMLIQKCKINGAEFMSYDHVNGEWRFSVPHFS